MTGQPALQHRAYFGAIHLVPFGIGQRGAFGPQAEGTVEDGGRCQAIRDDTFCDSNPQEGGFRRLTREEGAKVGWWGQKFISVANQQPVLLQPGHGMRGVENLAVGYQQGATLGPGGRPPVRVAVRQADFGVTGKQGVQGRLRLIEIEQDRSGPEFEVMRDKGTNEFNRLVNRGLDRPA
jgi:hypothetical protein